MPILMILGGLSGAWLYQNLPTEALMWIILGALAVFVGGPPTKQSPATSRALDPSSQRFFAFLAGNTEASVNMGAPFLLLFFCLQT